MNSQEKDPTGKWKEALANKIYLGKGDKGKLLKEYEDFDEPKVNRNYNHLKVLSYDDYIKVGVAGSMKLSLVSEAINEYPKYLYLTIIQKGSPKLSKSVYQKLMNTLKDKEPKFYNPIALKNKILCERTAAQKKIIKMHNVVLPVIDEDQGSPYRIV